MLIGTPERDAMAQAWADLFDDGVGDILARVYSDAESTLLAEWILDDPPFDAAGTVNPGQLTLQGVPITTLGLAAAGAGTAALRATLVSKAGVVRGRGNVGLTGSGAFLTLDNLNIAEDQVVRLTGGTFTMPAGSL